MGGKQRQVRGSDIKREDRRGMRQGKKRESEREQVSERKERGREGKEMGRDRRSTHLPTPCRALQSTPALRRHFARCSG